MNVVRSRRVLVLLCSALMALGALAPPPARAGDLDPAQARTLATLTGYAKQIETNLKLAQDAAGPGTERPSDAKARLSRTRLAQPEGMLPQVRVELAKLPAEHADVVALRARLDAAEATLKALKARLDGSPTTGAPAPGSSGTGGGTKLDYKQQKELSDAEFYVREVEGMAGGLETLAREVDAAADKDAFDHSRLRAGAATLEKARQRAGLARGRLDALPAEGAGVRPVAERLTAALAGIDASEPRWKPVHQRVEALIDPAAYPRLAEDVRRLQDLARMLKEAPSLFAHEPVRAAAVVAEYPAVIAEHERIVAAYRPLVVQRTADGERVSGVSRYFLEGLEACRIAEQAEKASLPAALDTAFAETVAMADQAVAESKPAFFLGGIPQRLGQLRERVALQVALDPVKGAASRKRLEQLEQDLAARQGKLRSAIIAANEVPADGYAGPDRAALVEAAAAAWKRGAPGAEVLGVRIRAAAWERETMWRRQNATWYLIDRSRLQALVIVKHDGELAALEPVNLWKDHLQGDALTATPLHAPGDAPEPQNLIPLAKLR